MICMPTFEKAYGIWSQYWPIVTDPVQNAGGSQDAAERMQKYQLFINSEIQKQQQAQSGFQQPDERPNNAPGSKSEDFGEYDKRLYNEPLSSFDKFDDHDDL